MSDATFILLVAIMATVMTGIDEVIFRIRTRRLAKILAHLPTGGGLNWKRVTQTKERS